MPKQTRDYQAEYRRRIERAAATGLSRAQARGHPKASEAHASRKPLKPIDKGRLQFGLQSLRGGKSMAAIARELHVSPERLRHSLNAVGATEKRGRQWFVKDSLPRRMLLYSKGREETITVPNHKSAKAVGYYMGQVSRFLETNDRSYISLYDGMSVTDIHGVTHPFETDPNALYRLASSGTDSFEQIYRIVV